MKKFAPIIAAILIVGGYFGYTKFMGGGGGGPKETPAQAQATAKAKTASEKKDRLKAPIDGPVVTLGDTFIVTLPDTDRHFAKFAVSVKVDKGTPFEAAGAEAKGTPPLEELPQIRDIVIHVVSSHSYADLINAAKRDEVKDEIKTAINKDTEKTIVIEVYFTDFAVQ